MTDYDAIIAERVARRNVTYTELSGKRKFKQVSWSSEMPRCQAGLMGMTTCDNPGEFDSPTERGPWADLCEFHAPTLSTPDCSMGYHRIPTERPTT